MKKSINPENTDSSSSTTGGAKIINHCGQHYIQAGESRLGPFSTRIDAENYLSQFTNPSGGAVDTGQGHGSNGPHRSPNQGASGSLPHRQS